MNKKTIGVLVYSNPDYYPPTVNAIYLLSKSFDIVLIGRNQEKSDRTYPDNVQVHRLGQYSSVIHRQNKNAILKIKEFVTFVSQTKTLLKQASIIYAYDGYAYVAAMLCRSSLRSNIPIIYHSHEISEEVPPITSLRSWIRKAEKRWIHEAAAVVLPDKARADWFKQSNHISQVPIIVPNFPLKSAFKLQTDLDVLIESRLRSVTLFYRGSISNASAMKEIVSAASFVRSKIENSLKVKYVGFLQDGERESLEQWVEQIDANSYFSYLGTLPYDDLQPHTISSTIGFALYKATSIDRVACASACNKIYEYAACGLPTIVSDFSTYRDYLSGESWIRFVDPEDPVSIEAAIQDILSDREQYRKMCFAARAAFEEKFNFEVAFTPLLGKIKTCLIEATA